MAVQRRQYPAGQQDSSNWRADRLIDTTGIQAGVTPAPDLAAGFFQHPFADINNQAGFFGHRNENPGEIMPRSGCNQRIRASAPTIRPLRRLTLG